MRKYALLLAAILIFTACSDVSDARRKIDSADKK